jgi:sigma54-dependent transcription regulator
MAYRRRVHAGVRLNVLVTPLWQARPGRERCFRYDQCSAAVSPETTVRLNEIEFGDPGDFEHVYETLFKFARTYSFEADAEDYLIHITTGTHVAQICLFLLTESRYLPGRRLQASPERDRAAPGEIKIIDLDLSKYDRIASRFREEQSDAVSYLKLPEGGHRDTKLSIQRTDRPHRTDRHRHTRPSSLDGADRSR